MNLNIFFYKGKITFCEVKKPFTYPFRYCILLTEMIHKIGANPNDYSFG